MYAQCWCATHHEVHQKLTGQAVRAWVQVFVVTGDEELLKNLTEANRLLEQVRDLSGATCGDSSCRWLCVQCKKGLVHACCTLFVVGCACMPAAQPARDESLYQTNSDAF